MRKFSNPKWTACATAIVVSAALLRLFKLGERSLWLDESYRIYLARTDWHDFWRAATRPFGANSVAYHLVLRYWSALGTSEATLRGLSVVFGVAIVLAIYKLGNSLFDQPTGAIAAALVGANALLVIYSQEICAYTLAAFLAIISSFFFLRALSDDGQGNWAVYVGASILMVYSHVLSIFVIVAQGLALLLARDRRLGLRAVASLLAVGASFAALTWCLVYTSPHPRIWLSPAKFSDIQSFVADLGGPNGLALGSALLAFTFFGLTQTFRGEMTVNSARWRYTFVLLWALVPVVLLFVLSQRKPLFLSRYLLPSVPPLLLLVAATVRRLKPRWLAAACLVAILVLSVHSSIASVRYRADMQHGDDWRDTTAFLVGQARGGDAVVFYYHHERLPFEYYRDRYAIHGFAARVFPAVNDEMLMEEPDPIESNRFAETAGEYKRIWLVYSAAMAANKYARFADLQHFYRLLKREFHSSSECDFGSVRLILLSDPGVRIPENCR